jgi:gamma-glutamyltranspeptidase/glutathione hydrolase
LLIEFDPQRSRLGDPAFVAGMDRYQDTMIADDTAEEIRRRILDDFTQPVQVYNPDGLESLET